MADTDSPTPSTKSDPTSPDLIKPRVGDRSFDPPLAPPAGSSPSPDASELDPQLIKPRPGDRSL